MAVEISTNVEFIQANTTTNAGFILLPSTTSLAGRFLTIKDTAGTFGLRPLTLSTIGNDRFEEGTNLKRLVEQFGYITLASDGVNRWYTIDGTSMNTYTISSLTNSLSLSTQQMTTSTVTLSTLGFVDRNFNSVSTLYTRSTLLYLGSNVIGGSKCGPTQFIPVSSGQFLPSQIANLQLWLDSADVNTLTIQAGNVLLWRDKSGNRRDATGYNTTASYNASGLNPGYPALEFSSTRSMRSPVPANTFTTAVHGFFVFKFSGTAVGGSVYDPLSRTPSPGNGTPAPFDMYSFNGSSFRLIGNGTTNSQNSAASNVFVNTTATIYTFGIQSSATTTWNESINGTFTALTTTGTASYGDTASSFIVIGGRQDTAVFYQGVIAEVILYNVYLPTDQRQLVEGYLAWKWGLVANLPSNPHPYRYTPPPAFTLLNIPYFVSVTGGASPTFNWSFSLSPGTTNNSNNIFILTTGLSAVANTTLYPIPNGTFTFTTDGTTNATTGKLTTNLTFGTTYVSQVYIYIPGVVISATSGSFLYGAGPTAAPTLGTYTGGTTMSIAWTSPSATVAQPLQGSNIYFATDVAGNSRVASNVTYTGGSPFTTNGATNFTTGALTFNTNYYSVVQMSNALGTTTSVSASPQLFGSISLAPTIGLLTGGATMTASWTNNTSLAQPATFNRVLFYSDVGGTTLVASGNPIATNTTFTTDGTTATGNLSANLTFNTLYYARAASSNALNSSFTNSSGVTTPGAVYGAAPQAGSITSYTGGATMTATLGSTSTNAQPVVSSNVSFVATDGTTVVATRSGYTGGASYSVDGTAGNFTTGGPLVFNTAYFLRLALVNAIGITNATSGLQTFGAAPTANPSALSTTATAYYGTPILLSWTAPGAGTLARPVTGLNLYFSAFNDQTTAQVSFPFYNSITNSQTSLSIDIGNYGGPFAYGYTSQVYYALESRNALGTSIKVYTPSIIIQYQIGWGTPYDIVNGSSPHTWNFNAIRTSISVRMIGLTGVSNFPRLRIPANILGGITKNVTVSVNYLDRFATSLFLGTQETGYWFQNNGTYTNITTVTTGSNLLFTFDGGDGEWVDFTVSM
jgi:hypothetical protein